MHASTFDSWYGWHALIVYMVRQSKNKDPINNIFFYIISIYIYKIYLSSSLVIVLPNIGFHTMIHIYEIFVNYPNTKIIFFDTTFLIIIIIKYDLIYYHH